MAISTLLHPRPVERIDRALQPVGHPRVRLVDPEIFHLRFAPDCMTHVCRCRDDGDRVRLDACCQHGADIDLGERDAILARRREVAAVLTPALRDPGRWFDESEPEHDLDFPSGIGVRTATGDPADSASGCVFLHHDGRGCALHRAALAAGFPPESIKPAVCRLYPLAFGDGRLGLSDDVDRYSCAGEAGGPSVYRLARPLLGDLFGAAAIDRLDAAEREVLSRRLPLASRSGG